MSRGTKDFCSWWKSYKSQLLRIRSREEIDVLASMASSSSICWPRSAPAGGVIIRCILLGVRVVVVVVVVMRVSVVKVVLDFYQPFGTGWNLCYVVITVFIPSGSGGHARGSVA